jgi:hypothetical protein
MLEAKTYFSLVHINKNSKASLVCKLTVSSSNESRRLIEFGNHCSSSAYILCIANTRDARMKKLKYPFGYRTVIPKMPLLAYPTKNEVHLKCPNLHLFMHDRGEQVPGCILQGSFSP